MTTLSSTQRQIASLSDEVVEAGRRIAADTGQWKPLTIAAADSDKTEGLHRQLAIFKEEGPYLYADAGDLTPQSQRDLIAAYLTEFYKQDAAAKDSERVLVPYEIRDGEAWAKRDNISEAAISRFTAALDVTTLNALRLEVLPQDAEVARSSPEDGFVIQSIDAWLIAPDGREEKIQFSTFAPDSNDYLASEVARSGAARRAATRIHRGPICFASGARSVSPAGPAIAERSNAQRIVPVHETVPVALDGGNPRDAHQGSAW
jgi:hypothetical protein